MPRYRRELKLVELLDIEAREDSTYPVIEENQDVVDFSRCGVMKGYAPRIPQQTWYALLEGRSD
mgnify:FL=1